MKLYNKDCMEMFKEMGGASVDFICTDIPYGKVSRESNGLRKLDKEKADTVTFDLIPFLKECLRVCKGSILISCGMEQFSTIFDFFAKQKGTTRCIVWKKTNPSPMNGQHIYLSSAELCVWFKPRGWKTFNAFCKSNVFEYSCGGSKIHPTQKNLNLVKDLIMDNTNEGDTVLDPCFGSGTVGVACKKLNRDFIGCEIDKTYFDIAKERIKKCQR